MVNTPTFDASAFLAHMKSMAPGREAEGLVSTLLATLGETDHQLSVELAKNGVSRSMLAELTVWNHRIAPNGLLLHSQYSAASKLTARTSMAWRDRFAARWLSCDVTNHLRNPISVTDYAGLP
jgi:hypothetical protein